MQLAAYFRLDAVVSFRRNMTNFDTEHREAEIERKRGNEKKNRCLLQQSHSRESNNCVSRGSNTHLSVWQSQVNLGAQPGT